MLNSSKNSDLKEYFNINPNNKYYFRSFNFQKLLQERMDKLEENPTIFIALINNCVDNIKKSDWEDPEANAYRTNIEAILSIVHSITKYNKESKIKSFNKTLIYNYSDKNVQYMGDENIVADEDNVKSLAQKILSNNTKSSNICSVLEKLLISIDDNYSSYFGSYSKSIHSRHQLKDKKKVFVRIFMTMSSFELFSTEEIRDIILSYQTIYNIVINPLILNNDYISTRIISNFNKLEVLDFKNCSFNIKNSKQYLGFLRSLSGIRYEIDLSNYSEKLSNISIAINNEDLNLQIDSKLKELRKIYETLIEHQNKEKSDDSKVKENSENQIRLAKEYISKENKKIDSIINENVNFFTKIKDIKADIDELMKNVENVLSQIKYDNVDCKYYSEKYGEIKKRAKITQTIIDSYLNLKMLF